MKKLSIIDWIVYLIVFIVLCYVLPPPADVIQANPLPIVTAAIGLASNVIGNLFGKANWREQQEYNSPANQMARYRAAGLNPNVIYGAGGVSAGNASTQAPYQAMPISGSDVLAMANAVKQSKLMDAEIRKANADALGVTLDNQAKSIGLQYRDSQERLELALREADIAYRKGQISLVDYQKAVQSAQAEKLIQDAMYSRYNRENLQPALLNLRRQEVANATALAGAHVGLLGEQTATEGVRRSGMWLDNLLTGKDVQYYEPDRRLKRRSSALNAAANAAGTILSFGRFRTNYDYDYYSRRYRSFSNF